MSTDFLSQLRAEMERVPATAPPGLARQAYRHYRRRRITVRAIAAASAAGMTASAMVLAGGSAAPTPRVQTSGYVISHVSAALTALQETSPIEYLHATDNSRALWYRSGPTMAQERDEEFSPTGQITADSGHTAAITAITTTSVSYAAKTWWRTVTPAPPTEPQPTGSQPAGARPACSVSLGIIVETPSEAATQIRAGLSCGLFTMAGSEHIDGVDAVKLVAVVRAWRVTIWVNASTFLPVRLAEQPTGPGHQAFEADVRWLPPTAANLANLSISIPPGFIRVPPPASQTGA